MLQRPCLIAALYLASFPFVSAAMELPSAQEPRSIKNDAGLQLVVARENAQPVLRIVLPGQSESNRAIEVIFPEHVTARRRGSIDSVQLYMFRPGPLGERPTWRRIGPSLEYERELPGAVRMLARATLEDDGVRFLYQFSNRSDVVYDMIYAPIHGLRRYSMMCAWSAPTFIIQRVLICWPRKPRTDSPYRSLNGCHPGTWLRSLGPCQQSESSVAETVSAITTSRERSIYP